MLDTDEFIKRATMAHGNLYSYVKSVYVKHDAKLVITCKVHGDFLQEPVSHWTGSGCRECAIAKKRFSGLTTDQFIQRAVAVHGHLYRYSLVEYKNSVTPVRIECSRCGQAFEQRPDGHLQGRGCPPCEKLVGIEKMSGPRMTTEEYILRARKVHGHLYDYTTTAYNGSQEKIEISCSLHGLFFQDPASHLQGHGCRLCGIDSMKQLQSLSQEEFIERSIEVHGEGAFDYSLVVYISCDKPVKIKCNRCLHVTDQCAYSHMIGHGCRCVGTAYSKVQLEWLALVSIQTAQPIQTAESADGEFKVGPYRVDGYNATTKTVYEFHGCYWHGCFKCRPDRNECNALSKRTYRDLLYRTIKREQYIRDQGYTVEVMWEHTWTALRRVIVRAQRLFRARQAAFQNQQQPSRKRRAQQPLAAIEQAPAAKQARADE
jgi:hypothetical protein